MTDLPLPQRLALIIDRILCLLSGRSAGGIFQRRTLNDPALHLITVTLRRVATRFAKVLLRIANGTLRQPRQRPAAPRKQPENPPKRREWPYRLRSTPGWLRKIIEPRHHLNYWADALRVLVRDPELQELLTPAPQLRQILRPLCTMMGVEPPPLPQPDPPPKKRRRLVYPLPFVDLPPRLTYWPGVALLRKLT